jgi:branched-chain amino acid transport system substrate-binding protein
MSQTPSSALSGTIPIGILHADPVEVGPEVAAIQMALSDINNFVSTQTNVPVTFKFLEENAGGSATQAVERAQALIGEGVQIIIGSEWSSQCKELLPLVNDRQVVLFSQSSSSPSLSEVSPYLFRMQPDDTREALVLNREMVDLGIKALVCVYGNEAYAQGLFQVVSPKWQASGINVVYSLGVDPTKKDYTGEFADVDAQVKTALTKYSKSELGIWLGGTYGPIVPMLTSLAKYPDLLNLRVFDADSGGAPGYIQYAGDIASKVGFTAFAFGPATSPKYLNWAARYKSISGISGVYFTAITIYDCLWVAALSTLLAGNSGAAIAKILPTVADMYYGVSGWTELNPHDRKYPTYDIFQVANVAGTNQWKTIGFYDGVTDTIRWFT